MEKYTSEITGNLDIFVAQYEDECDGEIMKWQKILIHGDPEGLKSLATLLIKIADTNQNDIVDLPIGAREHVHLRPEFDLSHSSEEVIIGRLDAKGTGAFYDRYVRIDNSLEKYKDKVLFKDKLDKANEMLKTTGLPKSKKQHS
jgi:hypothetical protein